MAQFLTENKTPKQLTKYKIFLIIISLFFCVSIIVNTFILSSEISVILGNMAQFNIPNTLNSNYGMALFGKLNKLLIDQ